MRGSARPSHLTFAIGVGLWVVAVGFLSEPPGDRSTAGDANAGGGTGPAMAAVDLPTFAHAAIEGRVLRVLPAVASTPDGQMPPVDTSLGPDQWNGIYPLTRLVFEVDTILGQRVDLQRMAPGLERSLQRKSVLVELTGGSITTTLSAEAARTMGVELPPGHRADVEIATSVAPGVLAAEGDRLVLFVVDDGDPKDDVVRVVGEGAGAFVVGADDHMSHVHAATAGASNHLDWSLLNELASTLNSLASKPSAEGD